MKALLNDLPKNIIGISIFIFIIVFAIIGVISLAYVVIINLAGVYAIVFIYFFLKALVVDIVRIKNRQSVSVPGFVYWAYGLQYAGLWMANDLLYNNLTARLSPDPHIIRTYLLYQNPLYFWLAVEVVTSVLILPFAYYLLDKAYKHSADGFLMLDVIRGLVFYMFANFLGDFLLTLP
jgi:hypothetical protein